MSSYNATTSRQLTTDAASYPQRPTQDQRRPTCPQLEVGNPRGVCLDSLYGTITLGSDMRGYLSQIAEDM
ncbi:hypothetical protein T03_15826 [Trichinella britovi]|uniref:Uncharacterized protein n=1 Tax=Trichinella britovi TaxID=45882 RepID=A0A0V1D4L4_TRIBR|nr:hypothetical protein T03_15826 [Trichinella britovi]